MVAMDRRDNSSVLLSPGENGVVYEGPALLLEYEVLSVHMKFGSARGVDKGLMQGVITVVLRRRMEYHLTNTFLQTFLLVIIGFLSFFFRTDKFTDRIMVTLTTMLVVATIMGSIQDVTIAVYIPNVYFI